MHVKYPQKYAHVKYKQIQIQLSIKTYACKILAKVNFENFSLSLQQGD